MVRNAMASSSRLLFLLLIGAALAAPSLTAADTVHAWTEREGFLPLKPERIAALPAGERAAWEAYWKESEARMARHRETTTSDKPATEEKHGGGASISRGLRPKTTPGWYASAEAQALADQVAAQQAATGGWTKGNNYTQPLPPGPSLRDSWNGGTIDNDATITELRFLAQVVSAAPADADAVRTAAWRAAFDRGLGWVFAAQYPNGGFPQVYPLVGGYHDAITYNDNAMIHALELLRDVAAGQAEFAFVPGAARTEAQARQARGIACVLATQIREPSGRRTVWCQQHDALTQQPCAARNFEPIASCTAESSALVDFLMRVPDRTPEIAAAIENAVAWFERAALHEVRWDRSAAQTPLVPAPGAPPLWGRMHEIGTDKPIFGDRDRTVHYELGELSAERQHGYAWFGDWPASRVAKWRKATAKKSKE